MSSAAVPQYVLKLEKHDFRGEVLDTLLVDLRTEKIILTAPGLQKDECMLHLPCWHFRDKKSVILAAGLMVETTRGVKSESESIGCACQNAHESKS